MELRDYLLIIKKSWGLIVWITLLITIATIIWSVTQPIKYEAGVTIVVNKSNPVPQRNANFFQYDKYYSIQASSLQADTLAAWLTGPGTAQEIFAKAGYVVPDESLKKLGRIFKPRQLPPVTLIITLTDKDKTKAEKLVQATVTLLDEKTKEQRKNDDPDNYFSIISGPTVVAQAKQDLLVNTLLALLGGAIVGLIVAYLKHYLKES